MAADPQMIKRRFDALKTRRSVLESHCEEIAEVISPRHTGFNGYRQPNEKRMSKVYDSTGIHSLEMLAAGLHGLLTNPASKWFSLRIVEPGFDDDDQVKDWLSDASDVMRAYMYAPGTNITSALHEIYLENGAFGTSVMFIGERDKGGLLYQSVPLHECFIAENHEGTVDTVFRKRSMTARQVLMQWPKSTSEEVRKKVENENKPDEMIEIIHAVQPRRNMDGRKRNAENMPWESVYIEYKTENKLEESGFPEFPYAVPRWSKMPGEEYGRSPAMTALPDVKMLQEMMKTTMQAGQLAVKPPVMVPDDGVIGPVRWVPGGQTYYRGDRIPTAVDLSGNLPITLEMMEELRGRIRGTFFADLMNFPTDVTMTATEFTQRMSERMRLLGPVLGRMEGEMLGRIVERTFGIMTRMGVLPQAPAQVAGREFTIEFVSPIALAQKQGEANALTQTLAILLPFIQATQDASVLKPFKTDKLAPKIFELFGGDPDLIYSTDELAEMAEAEQAQQQAMMAAQAAQPMADAMSKGAGAVDKLASAQQKGADVSQLFEAA